MDLSNNTTVGKTFHAAKYLVAVNLILAVLAVLLQQKELFNPEMLGIFTILNLVLVAVKNYFDSSVPNI